jgi:hypothetical protein
MDDDKKIIKIAKKMIKSSTICMTKGRLNIVNDVNGNGLIAREIIENKPFLVSRLGATEAIGAYEFIKKGNISKKNQERLETLSGVFPVNDSVMNEFAKIYIDSLKAVNILGLWGVRHEDYFVKNIVESNTKFTYLRAIEPYYFANPWSEYLKNKHVLVIHPFKDTIEKQYRNKREAIFIDEKVLPKFQSLFVIKAVQSIANSRTEFRSWIEAYNFMCDEINKVEFDIAIVGAGAYGLPLCAYIKSLSKQAIHMAGATQILFGIKGKRWDTHSEIAKLYNEQWVRADELERPFNYLEVEGGSYW